MSKALLDRQGYKTIKISKYITKIIRNGIILNLNKKFKDYEFDSMESIIKYIKDLPDHLFIKNFGHNALRILDDHSTFKVNQWVKNRITKELNCKKASLNIIANSDLKINKFLKKKQYNVFFRLVRKNRKDVGFPHRDSSFWKLGIVRKTHFKYNARWKLWIPIIGTDKKNSLRLIKSSHNDNIKVKFVKRRNKTKPKISKEYIEKNVKRTIVPIKKFDGSEGMIFHDDLVHYAKINRSTDCRISAEFNILVK